MKIVSDNEEFLKEIETRFKKERVKVTSVKVPADVTDKGIDCLQKQSGSMLVEQEQQLSGVLEMMRKS